MGSDVFLNCFALEDLIIRATPEQAYFFNPYTDGTQDYKLQFNELQNLFIEKHGETCYHISNCLSSCCCLGRIELNSFNLV